MLQTIRIKKIQDNYRTNISEASPKDPANNPAKSNKNKGIRKFFQSISDLLFSNPFGIAEPKQLKFVCMNCGTEHKDRRCPNCGSGAVSVE